MRKYLHCAIMIAMLAQLAAAQQVAPTSGQVPESTVRDEKYADRKSPGWLLHRPDKGTPTEQLALAKKLEEEGKHSKARSAFDALVHEWAESTEAMEAQYSLAKLFEKAGRYERAFEEYQYLAKYYTGMFPYEDVLSRQFSIANLIMTQKHWRWMCGGFTAPERATPMFEHIVDSAPRWERAPDAQFSIAAISEENGDLDVAAEAYETLLRRYRTSSHAAEAAFRRAMCLCELVERAPRDTEGYRDALSALSYFITRFEISPGKENAENIAAAKDKLDGLKERLAAIHLNRAEFYEQIAKKPDSALIAYEDVVAKFRNTSIAAVAARRIEQLKTASMEKHTDDK